MPNDFEPFQNKKEVNNAFRVWEYESVKNNEETVEINEEEALHAELERLKQEAIEKGYAQGMQQAQAEITEKKKELARWFDLLQNPIKLVDEQVTQEIIQTLIWLSQHCIGVELSIHPDKLRNLLQVVKAELPSLHAHKELVMNPQDVEWVKTEIDDKEIPGVHEILVADPTLNRGDFYLRGKHSELDGCIHTRLSTLFAKYINKDSANAPIKPQELTDGNL
jgi:flagellar assembly protein FliH